MPASWAARGHPRIDRRETRAVGASRQRQVGHRQRRRGHGHGHRSVLHSGVRWEAVALRRTAAPHEGTLALPYCPGGPHRLCWSNRAWRASILCMSQTQAMIGRGGGAAMRLRKLIQVIVTMIVPATLLLAVFPGVVAARSSPTEVAQTKWLGGRVLVTTSTLPDAALRVLWYHNHARTTLGIVPYGASPASRLTGANAISVRPAGRLLLMVSGGYDLWVAEPAANTLRRVASLVPGAQYTFGSVNELVWWCVVTGGPVPCTVQSVSTARTILTATPGLARSVAIKGQRVIFTGPGWHVSVENPNAVNNGSALYTAAVRYLGQSALPVMTSIYGPALATASVRAKVSGTMAFVYVYLTGMRYPLNSKAILANTAVAGFWGGFGTSSKATSFAFDHAALSAHVEVPSSIGKAIVARPGLPSDEVSLTRGPWQVVVACGSNNLQMAELIAASLPAPPTWARQPVVAVCNAGDGEHTVVYARDQRVWVEASNYHDALSAIDLFQSLEPGRTR